MAEGLLGGILGEEDEKPEVEAPESGPSVDAFAAAVAALASRQDPGVARKTEEFLGKQSHLLDIQARHLEDEHALRLAHLRNQIREEGVRRFLLRLRVGFQVFLFLIATAFGLGAALIVRDAITSRQVVIDPIDVSATVAGRVPSGKIIASSLLDELSRLQGATRSGLAAIGAAGAWTREIRLEVPGAGVSLADVSHLMKERFGHDVNIDGDLIGTPTGGVALTVRGTGVPPKTFSGTAADLDKLTVAAAEYVYANSQPVRWARYLTENNRRVEAMAFCQSTIALAAAADRPELLKIWGFAVMSSGGSVQEALTLHRASVKLNPEYWSGHLNIQNDLIALGDEEGSWKAGEEMRAIAGGRPGRAPEDSYDNWDLLTWNLQTRLKWILSDAAANAGVGSSTVMPGPTAADMYIRLHDTEAAELALKTAKPDPGDPAGNALIHNVRGRLAMEANNVGTAVAELEAYGKAHADPAVAADLPGYHCWIAPAEEAAGHPDRADALLKTAGTFVDCYRFRADILDGRGDWAGAAKAYADAVALAPDLPAAYYSWGLTLVKHGDLASAETKLKDASQRGPHWADPLKAWGDALMKQGKSSEALAKYDEALKYAPNWTELKESREAMAKQKR